MPTRFCRHIKVNGERCGSPALTNEIFCYYHVELERRHRRCSRYRDETPAILHPLSLQNGSQRDPILAEPIPPAFQLDFPPLEDCQSIQVALSLLITALAQGRIDPKRAALLFYGLQIASANARGLYPLNDQQKRTPKVRETVLHEPSGELIAPDQDPEEDTSSFDRPVNSADILYAKFVREREEREERAEKERLAAEARSISEQGLAFFPPPS